MILSIKEIFLVVHRSHGLLIMEMGWWIYYSSGKRSTLISQTITIIHPWRKWYLCGKRSTLTVPIMMADGRWVQDRGKNCSVSTIHRQPKKDIQISVSKFPLPELVLDLSKRTTAKVDPNHGLWGFFRDKALPTPEERLQPWFVLFYLVHSVEHGVERLIGTEGGVGQPLMAAELRRKSWEDLQKLWCVCVLRKGISWRLRKSRGRDWSRGMVNRLSRVAAYCTCTCTCLLQKFPEMCLLQSAKPKL